MISTEQVGPFIAEQCAKENLSVNAVKAIILGLSYKAPVKVIRKSTGISKRVILRVKAAWEAPTPAVVTPEATSEPETFPIS